MTGFEILNLFIGITFIYFILSIVCTVILEAFANFFSMRSKNLNAWIKETFYKEDLGENILQHSLIDGLTRKGRHASYIPSKDFTTALLDVIYSKHIDGEQIKAYDAASLLEAVSKTDLLSNEVKRYLVQIISEANNDLAKVKSEIGRWYDDAMDRITGGYKKKTQWYILFISIGVCLVSNADSIALFRYMYDNPRAAEQLALAAEQAVKDSVLFKSNEESLNKIDGLVLLSTDRNKMKIDSVSKELGTIKNIVQNKLKADSLFEQLQNYHLPLGWDTQIIKDCSGKQKTEIKWLRKGETWGTKFSGLIISAFALTLGAPFWFDLMNKLVNLRSSGKKPNGKEKKD